jgi:hypothetical protein
LVTRAIISHRLSEKGEFEGGCPLKNPFQPRTTKDKGAHDAKQRSRPANTRGVANLHGDAA